MGTHYVLVIDSWGDMVGHHVFDHKDQAIGFAQDMALLMPNCEIVVTKPIDWE